MCPFQLFFKTLCNGRYEEDPKTSANDIHFCQEAIKNYTIQWDSINYAITKKKLSFVKDAEI
jgi:hypothetical protein